MTAATTRVIDASTGAQLDRLAHCKGYSVTAVVATDDYAVTVVLDFVNPVGAGGRFRSFDRLSRDNEPGRKRLVFHSAEKIGRRIAGNNEPGVVFSRGLQLSGFWKKARMARPQTISMVPETLQDGDGPGLDDWG